VRAKLIQSSYKPNLAPAIRFTDEAGKRATIADMGGNVANDRHAEAICNEFLKKFSGNARFQSKEILAQSRDRNSEQGNPVFAGLRDQIDRILAGSQERPFASAFEYASTFEIVEFFGHVKFTKTMKPQMTKTVKNKEYRAALRGLNKSRRDESYQT
jgi:hypothetical protein